MGQRLGKMSGWKWVATMELASVEGREAMSAQHWDCLLAEKMATALDATKARVLAGKSGETTDDMLVTLLAVTSEAM